jgi:hypothetical protein
MCQHEAHADTREGPGHEATMTRQVFEALYNKPRVPPPPCWIQLLSPAHWTWSTFTPTEVGTSKAFSVLTTPVTGAVNRLSNDSRHVSGQQFESSTSNSRCCPHRSGQEASRHFTLRASQSVRSTVPPPPRPSLPSPCARNEGCVRR